MSLKYGEGPDLSKRVQIYPDLPLAPPPPTAEEISAGIAKLVRDGMLPDYKPEIAKAQGWALLLMPGGK